MTHSSPIQLFPLLRIAVCLILGIVLGDLLFHGASSSVQQWSMGLFVGLVVVTAVLRKHPLLQSALILAATCCLGVLLVQRAKTEVELQLPEDEVVYKAVVTSEPVERGKVVRCNLLITTGEFEGKQVQAAILRDTVDCLYKRLHVGDGILASSVFEHPHDFGTSHFRYSTYLESHGIVATTFIFWSDWRKAIVDISHLSRLSRIRIRAMKLRQNLLQRYQEWGLGGEQLAVVAAMTLGDKSLLNQSTREAYSVSGASHVLALSGLHLGIIYMLFLFLTMGRRRQLLGEACIVMAIWAYVVMVGMPSSVVRAALMITIYSVVGLIQRDRMSLNTLSLTAIIMLLARPLSVFDLGFQMSFLSVLFIIMLYRPIYYLISPRFLFAHRFLGRLWSMVSVSVAAQTGVAPLVAYYFGRFSCCFLLTNFVVIPVATLTLYMAALLFLLSCWPAVQHALVVAMSWLVGLQNNALEKISSIPGASIEDIDVNVWQVLVLYVMIFMLSLLVVHSSSSGFRNRGV